MAIAKKTIRLLILEDSQNEAERLVSLFRNAGHATRVHRLTSSDDLAEALQQSWDLLIAAPYSEHLDPHEALNAIRRQAKDIPFIQLVVDNDPDNITEALQLGAQDALPAAVEIALDVETCRRLVVDQPAHEAVLLLFVVGLFGDRSPQADNLELLPVAFCPGFGYLLAQQSDVALKR